MPQGQLGSLLRHLRRLVGGAPAADTPDAQLLQQFIERRDEAPLLASPVANFRPVPLRLSPKPSRDTIPKVRQAGPCNGFLPESLLERNQS